MKNTALWVALCVIALVAGAGVYIKLSDDTDPRAAGRQGGAPSAVARPSEQADTTRLPPMPPGADRPASAAGAQPGYSREAFTKAIMGKSQRQVMELLGKPRAEYGQVEDWAHGFDYSNVDGYDGPRVTDEQTGDRFKIVVLWFDRSGVVGRVRIS